MTVSDKLTKIQQIKNSIRFAANSKGAEISESDSFEDYPGKIEAIPAAKADLPDFSEPVPIGTFGEYDVYMTIVHMTLPPSYGDTTATIPYWDVVFLCNGCMVNQVNSGHGIPWVRVSAAGATINGISFHITPDFSRNKDQRTGAVHLTLEGKATEYIYGQNVYMTIVYGVLRDDTT